MIVMQQRLHFGGLEQVLVLVLLLLLPLCVTLVDIISNLPLDICVMNIFSTDHISLPGLMLETGLTSLSCDDRAPKLDV